MTTDPNNLSQDTGAPQEDGVGEELKRDAGHLADSFRVRASEEAEAGKRQAASALGSASSAMNKAADELQRNSDAPDWLASAVKQAASKIDTMAGQLQGRDISEIGRSLADFARQNPGTFLAASAAAGFAAARVVRAGADRSHDVQNGTLSGYDNSARNSQGNQANQSSTPWQSGGRESNNASATADLADTVESDIGGVVP
jgi:hypothetical protein